MTELIFDCNAITVYSEDSESVLVYGHDGNYMTLEEIRDFGQAIVKYFENQRGVNVFSN